MTVYDRFWIVEQYGPTRGAQEIERHVGKPGDPSANFCRPPILTPDPIPKEQRGVYYARRYHVSITSHDDWKYRWRVYYEKAKTLREGISLAGRLDSRYPVRLRHRDTGQIVVL